ncbi:hypothetical protein F4604DRAFT_1674994 [Suillus subluteus]|nr:hypothetical protein F4604DRAFT_1674994 [Suillus subluteus]
MPTFHHATLQTDMVLLTDAGSTVNSTFGFKIAWFTQFPECAVVYPDIPMDVELTHEQSKVVELAQEAHEAQLHTWFRWHANSSKKNCSLKKKMTVFDKTLELKRRVKSEAEIYSEIYYNKCIKSLVMAEQEAGNVATSSKCVALGRKFSKELLEDKTEDIKTDIRAKGIDDLPVICRHFAKLVKQKTRFMWPHSLKVRAAGNKRKPDLDARNKVKSSEIGDSVEEESEKGEEDEEGEEDEDQDEEGEEEYQLTVVEGEGNQSMESAITLPIPGASLGDASGVPDASIGTTESSSLGGSSVMHASMETTYGTLNDASYYGMTMYDTQPQAMHSTHVMYGGQAHPMYGAQGPTYDAQGTSHALLTGNSCLTGSDASLHSQGTMFPMQMSNYTDFGIPPSNSFTRGAITPEFSFNQGTQAANWKNQAWNDSLPTLPSPEPHEDLQPVLPSPNPILSMDDTCLPSIAKAAMTTGRRVVQKGTKKKKGDGQKHPNTKSMVGQSAARPSTETATPGQAKSSSKKLSVAKPSPGQAIPSTEMATQSSSAQRTTKKKQPPAAKPLADEGATTTRKPSPGPSPNPIVNVTGGASCALSSDSLMNTALDTEVHRKCAIGTNSVSFFTGKENLLEAEAPHSLKRPVQSEASSAPKKKQTKA